MAPQDVVPVVPARLNSVGRSSAPGGLLAARGPAVAQDDLGVAVRLGRAGAHAAVPQQLREVSAALRATLVQGGVCPRSVPDAAAGPEDCRLEDVRHNFARQGPERMVHGENDDSVVHVRLRHVGGGHAARPAQHSAPHVGGGPRLPRAEVALLLAVRGRVQLLQLCLRGLYASCTGQRVRPRDPQRVEPNLLAGLLVEH
mmetsp:Transcript_7052/g.19971  ORF Transcript_7052/g.19971 Transcript_7052/m.19971 type:complete len:200 (+) Transcript_7052:511-1110(+)